MDVDEKVELDTKRAAYWLRWNAAERKLSLDQLAIFAGLNRATLYNVIGGTAPRLRTLSQFAAYLGIETYTLLLPIPDDAPELTDSSTPDDTETPDADG